MTKTWAKVTTLLLAVVLVVGFAVAEEGAEKSEKSEHAEWLTDFEKAKELAADNGQPVLINFSGSDWCGWCIRLDEEVLSKAVFQEYAKDNLVLFVADFPRAKEVPAEVKKQNQKLLERYGVRGFPTLLMVGEDGEVLFKTGYRRGGAEAYVKHLKEELAAAQKDGEKES